MDESAILRAKLHAWTDLTSNAIDAVLTFYEATT